MELLPMLRQRKTMSKFVNPLVGVTYHANGLAPKLRPSLANCSQQLTRGVDDASSAKCLFPATSTRLIEKQQKLRAISVRLNNWQPRCSHQFANNSLLVANTSSKISQKSSILSAKMNNLSEQSMTRKESGFMFPNVHILVLDAVKGIEDLASKIVVTNFQKYFAACFKDQLVGPVTANFIRSVEKYLKDSLATCSDESEPELQEEELPQEYFTLKSKQSFLNTLTSLQLKARESSSRRAILQFVRFYCIPTAELRASFMRDILLLLSEQAYEKFSLNRDQEYVLLDEKGAVVEDILHLSFSANKLLLAGQNQAKDSFLNYQQIVNHFQLNRDKFSFRDTLKKNFRASIQGKYDDDTRKELSPDERYCNLKRAEETVEIKNCRTSKAKINLNEFIRKKQKLASTPTLQHSKPAVVAEPASSIAGHIQREFEEIKKMHELNHPESVEQIRRDSLLPLSALLEFSVYFKTKTKQQQLAMLSAFGLTHSDSPDLQSLTLSLESYAQLRGIVNCLGSKETINSFFDRYLQYNQYGELTRRELSLNLKDILGESKSSSVVEQILWCSLEKSKAVTNGLLLREKMHSCYDQNKTVYYLLISLIFGTNETTPMDLAHDILL